MGGERIQFGEQLELLPIEVVTAPRAPQKCVGGCGRYVNDLRDPGGTCHSCWHRMNYGHHYLEDAHHAIN